MFVLGKNELSRRFYDLRHSKILAIDTETTGLDPWLNKVRLVQIASPGLPVLVIDLWDISQSDWSLLKNLLAGPSIKVFHNAKFDLKFLKVANLPVNGQVFDTMLAAKLLRTANGIYKYGLADLAFHYLGEKINKEHQKSDWSGRLTKEQLEYASMDASLLLRLREALVQELRRYKLIEVAKLEFDCIPAVAEMELTGFLLDRQRWDVLKVELISEQREASAYLKKELQTGPVQLSLFGNQNVYAINLESPKQVLAALQKKGIALDNTAKSSLITHIENPLIKVLLDYRRASKALQAFMYSVPSCIHPVTGRIHSNYQQIGASTGRFSCSGPNLQQIPRAKEFRECFIASQGYKLIIADYSQIELRVVAELSQDKTMIEAFKKEQDIHRLTAALLTNKNLDQVTKEERQAAKAVNFGLIYAMGVKGLQAYAQETYGVQMTEEKAQLFRDRFFEVYQGVAKWHQTVKSSYSREIRTLSGRLRLYKQRPSVTGAYNTPVQGTSADIIKKAMAMLVEVLSGTKIKLIATIHDEIIVEAPEEQAIGVAELLKETMEQAGTFYLKSIPVVVDVGVHDNWAEK